MDMDFYRYGFHSGPDTMTVLSVLAFVAAVVCTVLLMVLVTPEKRRAKLNKFFRAVADICNFKGFLVEYIVRALYIFLTLFYILVGFFTLFVDPLTGLLVMVLGPIVLQKAARPGRRRREAGRPRRDRPGPRHGDGVLHPVWHPVRPLQGRLPQRVQGVRYPAGQARKTDLREPSQVRFFAAGRQYCKIRSSTSRRSLSCRV